MSELLKFNNCEYLIICFGGMGLKMGQIPPFEFLNYLSSIYKDKVDLAFYIDREQCWYHRGFKGITKNIKQTKRYLNKKIIQNKYKKIIFMGVSAGGYASILFGSLLKVSHVISFIPRTKLDKNYYNEKYKDLKKFINNQTKYIIYGDLSEKNINGNHHISQCMNIESFKNVILVKKKHVDMKKLRDNGEIKNLIDNILEI